MSSIPLTVYSHYDHVRYCVFFLILLIHLHMLSSVWSEGFFKNLFIYNFFERSLQCRSFLLMPWYKRIQTLQDVLNNPPGLALAASLDD